jgi:hypothetical protein
MESYIGLGILILFFGFVAFIDIFGKYLGPALFLSPFVFVAAYFWITDPGPYLGPAYP